MSIAKVSHSPDGIYSWWRDLTRSVIAHGCAHSVSCNALQPKQAVLLSSITCKDESSNYQEYVQTHARLPGRPQHIAAARAHYATPLPRLRRQQAEITTHGRITLAPTAAAHIDHCNQADHRRTTPPSHQGQGLASREVARLLEEDQRTDRAQTLGCPLDAPCLHDAV